MKYRRLLTKVMIVPTFIFLSGVGIPDESWAGTAGKSCPNSGKASGGSAKSPFKNSVAFNKDFKANAGFQSTKFEHGGFKPGKPAGTGADKKKTSHKNKK